jgi:nucleoside-diphosphate-sugar epimerase
MISSGTPVLVTGASGFIGTHLAKRLLHEGADVRLLIRYSSIPVEHLLGKELRENCQIIRGDIRDFEAVSRAMNGASVVFHLAALVGIPYSYECPAEVFSVNAGGSANVLDAARRQDNCRVVQTSTSEVYGSAQQIPMPANHPLHAQSPYAASKIAADQLALSYWRSFNLPVAILRPFNTYGPGQSARAVIPTILRQALRGECIQLGNADATRDFNYVDDTVEAFLRAGFRDDALGEETPFGSGREVSIREIVEMAGELTQKNLRIESRTERQRPSKSEVHRLICDPTTAASRLDWKNEVSMLEGLKRTLEWLKSHPDHLGGGYEI